MISHEVVSEKDLLDFHKVSIIKELRLKYEPPVLYQEEAVNFIRITDTDLTSKSNDIIGNPNGYFHFKNLPKEYTNTGVVCVFNKSIGTLAHELCHAKQFQDKSKWMRHTKVNKLFYKFGYAFYPSEREANEYATRYLEKNKIDELPYYKKHVQKGLINNSVKLSSPLICISFILLVLFFK